MNWKYFSSLSILMLLFTVAVHGESDDMKALQARFKERLPAIQSLKSAGAIGETFKGMLESPTGKVDADAGKLLDEENADRRKLYAAIATQEGVTPQKVAERNAARNFQKAKAGEYLKGEDGQWSKKK